MVVRKTMNVRMTNGKADGSGRGLGAWQTTLMTMKDKA